MWETDNENVLTLDPVLGIGKVQAVGSVVVKHRLASVCTFVSLETLPVNLVSYSACPPTKKPCLYSSVKGKVSSVPKNSVKEGRRESSTHSRLWK
jgi:hypothetical protein